MNKNERIWTNRRALKPILDKLGIGLSQLRISSKYTYKQSI
jgi:hypothetical protein